MKRRPQGKRKLKGDFGKLQKFKTSVQEFVKRRSASAEAEDDSPGDTLPHVKRKSRKELRKEKRKLKKLKMKNHYEGKPHLNEAPHPTAEEAAAHAKSKMKKNKGKGEDAGDKEGTKKDQVRKTPAAQPDAKEKSDPVGRGVKRKRPAGRLEESRKKALLEANVAEDKEIKRLEKYLGLHRRKNKKTLPQSFAADGLDYILGALDASAPGLYDSEEEADRAADWLGELGSGVSEEEEDSGEEEQHLDVRREDEEGGESEEDLERGEDSDEEDEGGEAEGPDVPGDGGDAETGAAQPGSATGKYVPPALRESVDSTRRAQLERLRRSVKGLVNRLSEPNMASISGQLEQLYMSHSRKDMSDTLTDVLLSACVSPALMADRLLLEHVLLVSVLHHTVGLEVGAQFLETVVRRFEELYQAGCEGKECDNLLAIIAHLYNFHVVHALLIFDLLRKLTSAFAEKDIELVLLLLRNVGFALRKDDALALKELISEAQRKASALGAQFQDQNRVRFMLETMLALKNNDMRKIPGYDPEPVERLRKLQRTLIHHSTAGSDVCLRVSLDNLLAADQVGRWWIVGSSWAGAPMIHSSTSKTLPSQPGGQFSSKVLDLARKQRMNTDIRRNIFCVLMTCEDYLDAFEKLLRLGLKDQQEREIVRVLMDCCLQEKTFNTFYAVLGEKFCSYDRRFQMTFQFSMWDKFRDLPSLSKSTVANLVPLLVHLLKKKALSLSVLKAIEFSELDRHSVSFLRRVLGKLLTESEPEELVDIFGRISGVPKLAMLREGLKLFISHFLLKGAQSLAPGEPPGLLKERADLVTKAIEARDSKLKL
ncbi:nucleolar MIF4G domain-containing protein 1 [Amia ocellicauda]|uniref:nucleolar MIF4G domain-containing protein 1 n=1 Tax=Amia ocellicauda TaxID=2972642 RepID=UPI003464B78C